MNIFRKAVLLIALFYYGWNYLNRLTVVLRSRDENALQTLYNNTAHLRPTLTIDFCQQNIACSPKALEMVL